MLVHIKVCNNLCKNEYHDARKGTQSTRVIVIMVWNVTCECETVYGAGLGGGGGGGGEQVCRVFDARKPNVATLHCSDVYLCQDRSGLT